MSRGRPPELRFPPLGPFTRATLLHDFVPVDLDVATIDWDEELPAVIEQRLAGVAQRLIDERGLEPPDSVRRALRAAVFDWTQFSCMASSRATIDLGVLHDRGIDFVVTKGPGIACHAPRLAERPYSDIDIFVAAENFSSVRDLLVESGYGEEDKNLVPRPALGTVCREAVNLRSPAGGSLDLHHRIPPWFWGSGLTFDDVLARCEVRSVPGGGSLPCASAADNLLVSALHIVSDKNSPGATLMAWRDVLLLARASGIDDVLRRAQETGLCGWVNWVFSALPDGALPAPLMAAFAGQDPAVDGNGRLTMVMSTGIASRRSVLNQVYRLPVSNAFRYLAGLIWPTSEYLASKLGDVPHPHLQWWRTVLRGAPDDA